MNIISHNATFIALKGGVCTRPSNQKEEVPFSHYLEVYRSLDPYVISRPAILHLEKCATMRHGTGNAQGATARF
jgi:hypothetical protein